MPRSLLPARRVIGAITVFWVIVVMGGVLGVLAPKVEIHTPAEKLLPAQLISNAWVYDLVHIRFAQIQTFVDQPVARPSAPFPYTNDWGSGFAVLIPIAILAAGGLFALRWRFWIRILLALSIVPLVMSGNRGAWVSVGVGLLYAAIRFALRGRARALAGVLVVAAVAVVVVVATPLGDAFRARLVHPQSNVSRESLVLEASQSTLRSPLFGYGAPRPSQENPNLPSVGTHGQLWLILFSHGIPATLFFLGWFLLTLWRTRGGDSTITFWANVVVFIAVFQMAYYTLLPAQIHVVMAVAALAWRERDDGLGVVGRRGPALHEPIPTAPPTLKRFEA